MGNHAEDEDLKAARGTVRADRQAKTVVLSPMVDMVKTPKGLLTTRARREWTRVVRALKEGGIAAEADKSLLIAYCNEMANYQRMIQEIAECADLKLPIRRGLQSECTQALKNSMKLGEMFGLTPSARGKIKPSKKKQNVDPTEEEFKNLFKTA